MLRGAGDSFTRKSLLFSLFLVSWVLVSCFFGLLAFGFLVSWFFVPWFKRSCFLGFKNPPMFFKRSVPYYQFPISCFLTDIDVISKISRILSDGSSSFIGARLFFFIWSPTISIFINILFLKTPQEFIVFFRYLGVSKDKNSWFGGLVTGSEIPKS